MQKAKNLDPLSTGPDAIGDHERRAGDAEPARASLAGGAAKLGMLCKPVGLAFDLIELAQGRPWIFLRNACNIGIAPCKGFRQPNHSH